MIARFVTKHDKKVHRFLESLPGFLTWALLSSPIWLGLLYPSAVVYMLTLFTVYWSYLSFRHSIALFIGYKKYRHELSVNWFEECKKLDFAQLPDKPTLPASLRHVKHFILIPMVNEPERVLKETFQAIVDQTFPLDQLVIVITIEQRGEKEVMASINNLREMIEPKVYKFLTYIHPSGIPGEAIGAGAANRSWGARHAVDDLKAAGENLREYIFSTIDADHVLRPQYIARVTHLYLSADKRDNHYYSTAVYLFNNNLWRVPPMMRIEANAVTLGCLSDWIVTGHTVKDTFSAYSLSLQTLIDADYWDVSLGVDDTIIYWRAFFVRDGNFDGIPHFIPFSADAVEGKNFVDSHVALYKQLLRWGWGAIDFPLSVKEFLKNKKIALRKKLAWIAKHLEKRVIMVNTVFMITFGFSLVTLVNPYVKQSNFAYSLPKIMSIILTLTLACILPGTIFRLKFSSPMPKEWSLIKRFLVIFVEGPMIILNLLTYSFFPWIEAQTRMMFGKKMKDLYHTPKRA